MYTLEEIKEMIILALDKKALIKRGKLSSEEKEVVLDFDKL